MSNIPQKEDFQSAVTRVFRRYYDMMVGDTEWARSQSTWYINADTGDDNNVGDDEDYPLRTFAEFKSRVIGRKFNQDTTVYIQSDLPSTDPLDFSGLEFGRGYGVVFRGVPTDIVTGTLTGKTNRSGSTGQMQLIADTGVADWTPYVNTGHMIEMTSGAANGYRAWILEDTGSGGAVTSTFFSQTAIAEASPGIGDTYKIIKLPAIARSTLNTISYGKTFFVYDLDLYMSSPGSNFFSSSGINFKCCRFYSTPYIAGFIRYYNCQFQILQGYGGLTLVWAGCVYQGATKNNNEIEHGQAIQLANGTVFYGATMNVIHGGEARIFDAGVVNATGDAVDMQDQGSILVGNLWGSGSTGVGVNARKSGKVVLNSAMGTPTIAGSSGELKLNATTTTWSSATGTGYVTDASSDAKVTGL